MRKREFKSINPHRRGFWVEDVCIKEAETFKGPSPSFIEGTWYQLADKHDGHGLIGNLGINIMKLVSNGFSIKKKKKEEFTISFFIHLTNAGPIHVCAVIRSKGFSLGKRFSSI